ncbi:hypothetical protein BKA70DRAFT_1266876 [Coprinopsis sp. MPI-PUGE-AT-0042]|nr:hypothetical protein BKA70DRAFT_1266876 [Coprinopsis sp. MPI-PUGE-AT-0042]
MLSQTSLRNGVVHLEGGWKKSHKRRGEGAALVVGGAGCKANLRFQGTSVSLQGALRPRPGASANARVSYRCTVNGFEWRTTAHLAQAQDPSYLCRSPALAPGEHTIEFEVEEAIEAEVMLEHFTLNEESRSLAPRDLVVVPVVVVEVVIMGPDVSTVNGTPTTVGWKPVGTTYVTTTGEPSLVPDPTSPSSSSTVPPTTSTPPPPPPTTEPPPTETTPPPPVVVTSQNVAPSTLQTSSSVISSPAASIQTSQSLQTLPPSASFGFSTYTMSSSTEGTTGLPGDGTAGSSTAGETKSDLAPGAIVGIALGVLALVAASIVAGWIFYLRRKRRPTLPMTPPSVTQFNAFPAPLDSPRAFSLDRKVGAFENTSGVHSSGNSMSGGSQGINYTNGTVPLPLALQQVYAPVMPHTPPSGSGHAFLQQDPMARSDDGHSIAPTYYGRPPTYHSQRQSTQSRPGYF